VGNVKPFDLAIFDEAHKTTGPVATTFAAALSDSRVPIRKRLFLTATPRHYDINRRDDDGDFKFVSMEDEAVYGPRAHTLTFSRAAKAGIICGSKSSSL
jgi:predicted helicase